MRLNSVWEAHITRLERFVVFLCYQNVQALRKTFLYKFIWCLKRFLKINTFLPYFLTAIILKYLAPLSLCTGWFPFLLKVRKISLARGFYKQILINETHNIFTKCWQLKLIPHFYLTSQTSACHTSLMQTSYLTSNSPIAIGLKGVVYGKTKHRLLTHFADYVLANCVFRFSR